MPVDRFDTLIVGGGQAGLAMSDMLTRRGCEHVILERGRIGERWRSERWDGLRFQFPNWSVRLPDFPYVHDDPDAFATSRDVVGFLQAYADHINAPIHCGVNVSRLRKQGARAFVAETSRGAIEAKNVVVAIGPYHRPVASPLAAGLADVFQVHASKYTQPEQLPPGAVLIVGSGASGSQIAEELNRAGRRVYLSVGGHRRMPRRYRGRDLIWWLQALGLDQTPVEKRGPSKALPLITGAYGGHTIDFRQFADDGIVLLGRARAARGTAFEFKADLGETLKAGDDAYFGFLELVDRHITDEGRDIPQEPAARAKHPDPIYVTDPILRLDLRKAGINSVIWATGYRYDFGWIDIPAFDDRGEPRHRAGVSEVPGLYFLGLPWLSRMNSSFLAGIGDDAAYLAEIIATTDAFRHEPPWSAVSRVQA